jgi:hypothetical protein
LAVPIGGGYSPAVPVSQGKRKQNSTLVRLLTGSAKDRPVFVGGCPRSGTTLLGQMLHAHPMLAMPPETRFVVESFRRRAKFGDLRDEANRVAVAEWIVDRKKSRFKDMKLDRDRVVERIRSAPPTIGSLSGAVLEEFAEVHGASRWGDKRPLHVQLLRILFRLYPDMQFIHLIRDARGTTASLKKLGWWGWGAPEALDRWRRAIEAGIAAREYLGPDQYIELRYEDLVDNPVDELHRLAEFLRIPYTEKMLAHYETGPKLIDKPYHERLAEPVNAAAVERWRTDLEPEELALVEAKVGPLLDEFGYQHLTDLPAVPDELEQRYRANRKSRDQSTKKAQNRERKQLGSYTLPVGARLTSGQKRLYYAMKLTGRA